MKISNKSISLEFNGKTIDSIKFNGEETLNQSKIWTKKFPVLFPALGLGNVFKYKKKEYPMPKHGFWNELDFKIQESPSMIIASTKVDRQDYPVYFELEQYISINKNIVEVMTKVTGEPAPMQMGYHPGFKVDSGKMKIKGKALAMTKDMKFEYINIDANNTHELDWDKYDSFIFETNTFTIENEKYDLKVTSNFKYTTLWTADVDNYICVEPYSDIPGIAKEHATVSEIDDTDWTMKMEYISKEKNDN